MSAQLLEPLTAPYRIMIVDDHKFLVELLAQRLESDPRIKIAGLANRASTVYHVLENEEIDIVLLDMDLGDDDGIEVAERIFNNKSHIRVIGLSVHDSDSYPIRLLELGGSGFISKQATGRDIVEGIIRVAGGEMAISPKIAVHIAVAYNKINPLTRLRSLSSKEQEVLSLVAVGHPPAEIARKMGVSEKTIHGHRANLKKKLCAKTDVELCLHAIKSGLIDPKKLDLDS